MDTYRMISFVEGALEAFCAAALVGWLAGALSGCGPDLPSGGSTCLQITADTEEEVEMGLDAARWVYARVPICGHVKIIRTALPPRHAGETWSPHAIALPPHGFPRPALTHECLHAALWRATGDPDREHLNPLFGDANVRDAERVHGALP